jgi:hypothetical protein
MRLHHYFSTKARSSENEKKVARIFKGKLQPASGALPNTHLKGDVKSAKFLVDAKVTKHDSYSLNLALWDKLNREAWANNRHPAFCIEFGDGTKLVVVSSSTFEQLQSGNL